MEFKLKNLYSVFCFLFLGTSQIYLNVNHIYQEDFKDGSYIIDRPGKYVLQEDIIFDPPENVSRELMENNPAFRLGFFAAIVIQAQDITLDLNGYEIKQSRKHYLIQRFYAHIELGSAPFVPNTGPHDFSTNFLPAKNVTIQNGILSQSSHHGVHGNNCDNIKLLNLKIKDFEVAAISLNGATNVVVESNIIGPIFKQVPVKGNFSAAVNILKFIHSLERGESICSRNGPTFLTIRRRKI